MYIRNLCADLGIELSGFTALAVDNDAAIKIANDRGITARNKHFEMTIHYFRHCCEHQTVQPFHVTTNNQRADGFTKPLKNELFKPWRKSVCHIVE